MKLPEEVAAVAENRLKVVLKTNAIVGHTVPNLDLLLTIFTGPEVLPLLEAYLISVKKLYGDEH